MNSLRISRKKRWNFRYFVVPLHGLLKVHYAFSSYRNIKFTIDYDRCLTKGDMLIMLKSLNFSSVSTGISQTKIKL